MLHKFLRSSSALALSVSLGLFITIPASAQQTEPNYSFRPAKAWDSKSLEQNGQNICSIATEMNNGFIVQITGAQQRFQTMNFNFRQAVFASMDTLEVTLSVPGQLKKTLRADVLKPELIAIDIQTAQDLMAQMRQSGVVDLYVGNNAFRFYMTGLSGASANFDTCLGVGHDMPLAALAEQSASEPQRQSPSPAIQQASQDARKKYDSEIEKLMGSVNDEKREGIVPVQEILPEEKTITVSSSDPMSQKPARPATRFTERLAAEMAKADGDSLDGGITIPKASEEPLPGETKRALAPTSKKSVPMTDLPDPVSTSASAPQTAVAPIATETEPRDQNAIKNDTQESIQWKSERSIVDSTKAMEEAPIIDLPPIKHSAKSPEPTVHKKTAQIEADFTDAGMDEKPAMEITVTPAIPPKSFNDKMAVEMQKQIETLRAENVQLSKELEKALRSSEKERLDVATDNWDLEQATMRYNEAERQINALGQKIQKERAQWAVEKTELESMLFDPAVTEQAQLARLATLEDQLAEAKSDLDKQRIEYEERLRKMRLQMQQSAPVSQ